MMVVVSRWRRVRAVLRVVLLVLAAAAFGPCLRVQATGERPVWRALEGVSADVFFWLGDNSYGDALDPDILAEEYRRQREVPAASRFFASVRPLATWDDHDFGVERQDRSATPLERVPFRWAYGRVAVIRLRKTRRST